MNVAVLDREAPRAQHAAQPVGDQAAVSLAGRDRNESARMIRGLEAKVAARLGRSPKASPVTNQPSKLSRLKSSKTESADLARLVWDGRPLTERDRKPVAKRFREQRPGLVEEGHRSPLEKPPAVVAGRQSARADR